MHVNSVDKYVVLIISTALDVIEGIFAVFYPRPSTLTFTEANAPMESAPMSGNLFEPNKDRKSENFYSVLWHK